MTRFVGIPVICVAALIGCARPRDRDKPPEPTAATVEQAARQAIRDYALGLAEAARAEAENVATYTANSQAWDANKAANEKAHEKAFEKLALAEDAAVPPAGPYDPALLRKMFLDEAAGYEKAVTK